MTRCHDYREVRIGSDGLSRDIPSPYFSIMDMKHPDEMNRKGLLHLREDQTVEYAKPACRGEEVTARILPS